MDPYATLGVKKDAKPNAIKRAFRNRAMATHPDRGGNQDEFSKVKLAYEILADKARRARYDATGDSSEQKPNNELAPLMGVLANVFANLVSGLVEKSINPADRDLAKMMRESLSNTIKALEGRRQILSSAKASLENLVGRFTVNEGDNLLDGMVRNQLGLCSKNLDGLAVEIEKHKQAADVLKRFSFRYDQRQEMWSTMGGTTATTSSIFFRGV